MNCQSMSVEHLVGTGLSNLISRSVALAALWSLFCWSAVANAAAISWDAPFTVVTDADIDRSAGPLLDAVNSTNTPGDIDVTIGGDLITFRQVDFTTIGAASQTGNGTFYTGGGGDTGNTELNTVFDSHAWSGDRWTFDLTGLGAGEAYQIQLIGAADSRGCCAARTIAADDDMGNVSGDYTRMGPGSVIGTFTADSDVQTIGLGPGTVDGVDPGISAYILRVIDDGSIPGDVNRDGVVDLFDYEIIRDNFKAGMTRDLGDLNFSGLVDYEDFKIWKDVAFPVVGGPAAVPEPGTMTLFLLGIATIGCGAQLRRLTR